MIYMDNAATTRMSERAFEAMRPFFMEQFANPAGTYSFAAAGAAAVDNARKQVAKVIGAKSAEIFFTCGGTESDNWALKGVMQANAAKGKHLIISAIEHHAILHTAQALTKQGCEVTVLPAPDRVVIDGEAIRAMPGYAFELPVQLERTDGRESMTEYTLHSSNTKIVSVSGHSVKGLKHGYAFVTVTTSNGKTAQEADELTNTLETAARSMLS